MKHKNIATYTKHVHKKTARMSYVFLIWAMNESLPMNVRGFSFWTIFYKIQDAFCVETVSLSLKVLLHSNIVQYLISKIYLYCN